MNNCQLELQIGTPTSLLIIGLIKLSNLVSVKSKAFKKRLVLFVKTVTALTESQRKASNLELAMVSDLQANK